MKIIKNKWMRIGLYILGFACVIMIFLSGFCTVLKYGYYPSDEDFDRPFEETENVRNEIINSLSHLQKKAYEKKTLSEMNFNDNELEMIDYSTLKNDAESDISNPLNDDKVIKMNLEELLGDEDVNSRFFDYLDNNGGEKTIYCAYPNMVIPKNYRYIRMTWDEYLNIVRSRCVKYSDENMWSVNNDTNHDPDFDDTSYSAYLDSETSEMYNKLQNSIPEYEISEGDYFTFIDNRLYMLNPSELLVYFSKYGQAQIPNDIKSSDYVYFPYNDYINAFTTVNELEDYILSSYLYRSDIEVAYSTVNEYYKSKLEENKNNNYYDGGRGNAAYSIDGETVDNIYLHLDYDIQILDKNNNIMGSSFSGVCEAFKKKSSIYVHYDKEKGEIEQWYKNNKGEIVPYEYISKEQLSSLTSQCDEDFVYGLEMNSVDSYLNWEKNAYETTRMINAPVWMLIIASIVFLLCVGLLIVGEPAKLLMIDKIPYLFWFVFCGLIITVCACLFMFGLRIPDFWSVLNADFVSSSVCLAIMLLIIYLLTAAAVMNVVRRIKCKSFLQGFITVALIKTGVNYFKKNRDRLSGNKLGIIFTIIFLVSNVLGLLLLSCLTFEYIASAFGVMLIIFDAVFAFIIFRYMTDMNKLLKTSKRIEAGELDAKVNVDELTFNSREMGKSLNNLGSGLSSAVENSVRDERTKVELITNVSHDIKTPLTSIINYVDLLKKEEIDNDKAKEYIDVIDKKSQRLKKLILDLIEASKTSTGNIDLECMKFNYVELINQVLGEFEDSLTKASLEVVKNFATDNAVIYADGRRVYRIIDNLLNNVIKYAQSGTRVYIDLNIEKEPDTGKDIVKLSIKNISRDMLNISAEELTERFVRGDRSRNTEGSGLGLSIARNLTELQSGIFDITIEGDLFKASVAFPLADTTQEEP